MPPTLNSPIRNSQQRRHPPQKNHNTDEIFSHVLRLSPTATHGDVHEAKYHCRLPEIGAWPNAQSAIRCDHLDSGHRATSFADFGQCATPRDARLNSQHSLLVGVGITIAHDPLHGSGRADFPHPALALGDHAHAAQGIGMTDRRQWQPASDQAPHTIPEDAAVLAASQKRTMPEPAHLEPKDPQRVSVHGHTVIPDVSTHHCLQPFTYFGDGVMHPSLQFGFHLVQLRLHPLADGNASTPPLRAAPHDSGPMWVATSHSYDFFIHYTSPV
jgi:hypothetical protein